MISFKLDFLCYMYIPIQQDLLLFQYRARFGNRIRRWQFVTNLSYFSVTGGLPRTPGSFEGLGYFQTKFFFFFFNFIHLFSERGEEREKEREISMCGCLSCGPHRGPGPATQACALTGNRTSNPLVCSPCSIH